MSLGPGATIGPFKIQSQIGKGGMGEVFSALDTRLDRKVAVKLLPPDFVADAGRLQRFQMEAKMLAALNHPNILSIFEAGKGNEAPYAPYLVSELLEGETLREKLQGGPIPQRRATDYALQIAHGLAAAHGKNLVHRDLKPENIFVTKDGRVKILDFGLAKAPNLKFAVSSAASSNSPTMLQQTTPGMILGTIGYMSPEQVHGSATDGRSDLFSFGTILFEMLSGKNPFQRDSVIETLNAIVKEEPEGLPATVRAGVERLVRSCLEKNPDQRFQSARDLAFALESIAGTQETSAPIPAISRGGRKTALAAASLGLVILGAFFCGILVRRTLKTALPSYKRLTFDRGTIFNARYGPGGIIYYSARWRGGPLNIYSTRPNMPGDQLTVLTNADLLSVSKTGELLVLLKPEHYSWFIYHGTLARFSTGTPRPILENVNEADWLPNGSNFVVIRATADNHNRIELHPGGKILYETSGYLSHLRASPAGDYIAFQDHHFLRDNRGWTRIINLQNSRVAASSREFEQAEGLAWRPDGKSVCFSASSGSMEQQLYTLSPEDGAERTWSFPMDNMLEDISSQGQVLFAVMESNVESYGKRTGDAAERFLLSLPNIAPRALAADGTDLVFSKFNSANYSLWLLRADGQLLSVGEGAGGEISPNHQQVAATLFSPPALVLYPIGPGEPRSFKLGEFAPTSPSWMNNDELLVVGTRPDQPPALLRVNALTGGFQVIRTNTLNAIALPNGQQAVCINSDMSASLVTFETGSSKPLRFDFRRNPVAGVSADSRRLWLYNANGLPISVEELNLETGERKFLRQYAPLDPSALLFDNSLFLDRSGTNYCYSLYRIYSYLSTADDLPLR